MKRAHALIVGVAVAVAIGLPSTATADWFDDWGDGWYERDPNDPLYDANDPYWTYPNNIVELDIDNPDWTIFTSAVGSDQIAQVVSDSVVDSGLRLACDADVFFPQFGICPAGIIMDDDDPNTSPVYWDDSTDHYVVTWVYYPDYYERNPASPWYSNGYNDPNFDANQPKNDPNEDKGYAAILLHADPANWTFHQFTFEFDNNKNDAMDEHEWDTVCTQICALNFVNFQTAPWNSPAWNLQRAWIDPNGVRAKDSFDPNTHDPNDTMWLEPPERNSRDPNYDTTKWLGVDFNEWDRTGLWMLFQFQQDPNHDLGDPNGKFLRAAIWKGDKYDWDGEYLFDSEIVGPWWSGDRGGYDPGLAWYCPEGVVAIAAWSDDESWGSGFPADCIYDNMEARTGVFTNSPKLLTLTVKNASRGTITIDPNLVDPNDTGDTKTRLRRFTEGTEVVMVGEAIEGKSFDGWTIFDPNYPGDREHAVEDTNSVLYLTMDADWEIEASFGCGSSEMLPPLGMVLLALGAGVVIRRKL